MFWHMIFVWVYVSCHIGSSSPAHWLPNLGNVWCQWEERVRVGGDAVGSYHLFIPEWLSINELCFILLSDHDWQQPFPRKFYELLYWLWFPITVYFFMIRTIYLFPYLERNFFFTLRVYVWWLLWAKFKFSLIIILKFCQMLNCFELYTLIPVLMTWSNFKVMAASQIVFSYPKNFLQVLVWLDCKVIKVTMWMLQ